MKEETIYKAMRDSRQEFDDIDNFMRKMAINVYLLNVFAVLLILLIIL